MILPRPPQIGLRHKIRTRTLQPLRQFFQPMPAIEFADSGHDGVAFGFRARVLDGFCQELFWNINCRFHASKIL